jgi:MinD superfamily P-loop ATPase
MVIAVASGKGGTGKTTVALSLALALGDAQFVDADAEEPNAHLFLHPAITETIPVEMMVPEVELSQCTFCGKCAGFCQFNALAVVNEQVLVFPEICHGCGGCVLACPAGAIRSAERQIGEVEIGTARGLQFVQGRLMPGEPSAVRIVRRELAGVTRDTTAIVDAPPGTACAVQEVIGQSDFCLLVTEPTPFGIHDLRMAMDLADELAVPYGIVINRSGASDYLIEDECLRRGVPMLLKIPFDRRIAEAYSRGACLVDALPEWRPAFERLFEDIRERAGR